MKKFIYTLITLIIILENSALFSMENITYRKAHTDDLAKLLKLINKKATDDADKIVILPQKFRKDAIEEQIEHGQLYVADTNDDIVGYKKIYVIHNKNKQKEILQQELRCIGEKAHIKQARVLSNINDNNSQIPPYTYNAQDTYIYNGGDFTAEDYRGKGINSNLMQDALEDIKKQTIEKIDKNKSTQLVFAYGLVKKNAGKYGGVDRTISLAKYFLAFAQSIQQETYPDQIASDSVKHYAYKAFMPTFDPENETCTPNPDNQSIPGYGNVLVYTLTGENNEK